MLRENTLWGIRDKEAEAFELLREHEPSEGYYVAYSGGKDSTVILDLVRRSGVKYDAHYNITTADPPELVYHIRSQPDVTCERPVMSMWQLIPHKLMPPTRVARYCCAVLKERGGQERTVITGVRAAESAKRRKRSRIETCYKDSTRKYLNLILDWATGEVWEYIHARRLDYCTLYDEGFRRLGCICCPLSGWRRQRQEAERWPKYKLLYIKAFDSLVKRRRMQGKPCEWRDGFDVWDWWTSPIANKKSVGSERSLFAEPPSSWLTVSNPRAAETETMP